jgi:hypothetical protein
LRHRRERAFIIIAAPYYAVLPELEVAEVLVDLEGGPRARVRALIQRQKAARRVGN